MNQALNISESVCAYFDGFDSTVDAFGGAIAGFEHDCIDDSPQMFSNGFGYFFHRFKPAAHRPTQPTLPSLERPGTMDIVPQFLGQFLDRPCSGGT